MGAKWLSILLVSYLCVEVISASDGKAEQFFKKAWNKYKLSGRVLSSQRNKIAQNPAIRTVDKTGTLDDMSLHPNEVAKKSAPVARSSCGVPSTLTEAEKADAADKHNELRSGEGSSNMKKLTYNEDLADRAQELSDNCHWDHGLTSLCDGTGLGQNMYATWGGQYGYPDLNVKGAIQTWFDEKEGYNYNTGACSIPMCGHYTQVVWANSEEVGCGVTRCPVLTSSTGNMENAIILVCNYAPAGNYRGQKPFEKGEGCSECQSAPGSTTMCDSGLCATCEPGQSSADCFCTRTSACSGQGTFDSDACACVCDEGFYGDECEESCACEDAPGYEWACPHWQHLCSWSVYEAFLSGVCKNTCNFCNPPPGAC